MISQHTPGPWETLTFSNHELQTDFAMVKIGSRVHMVGYSDEDKANACLIAAAPELLEFAEEVRRTGDTRLASMAIAVITKATGEAK